MPGPPELLDAIDKMNRDWSRAVNFIAIVAFAFGLLMGFILGWILT